MLFGPVEHSVVAVAAPLEEVFEHPSQPRVVRLFLELQRSHVVEVLYKFL